MTGDTQGRKLEVKSANLLLRIKYPRMSTPRNKTSKCKRIVLRVSSVENGQRGEIITSFRCKIKKTKWLKLGLPHSIVQSILGSEDKTLLLYVECIGCRKGTRVVMVHDRKSGHRRRRRRGKTGRLRRRRRVSTRRPFLILHTHVQTRIRKERSTDDNTCPSSSGRCCKSTFYVNFAEIGWNDWILHPRGYTTGECSGTCAGQDNGNSSWPVSETETRRERGVSLSRTARERDVSVSGTGRERDVSVSETGRERDVSSRGQCAPRRSKALRLVYYDIYGVLISSIIPNMIVTQCGCRRR
jgi:hypothetical protein